jgi:hypothetical protein
MKEKTLECICQRDTGVLALLINLLEVMQICKSVNYVWRCLHITEVNIWLVKEKEEGFGENYIMR